MQEINLLEAYQAIMSGKIVKRTTYFRKGQYYYKKMFTEAGILTIICSTTEDFREYITTTEFDNCDSSYSIVENEVEDKIIHLSRLMRFSQESLNIMRYTKADDILKLQESVNWATSRIKELEK
jgi:hypothetical protein